MTLQGLFSSQEYEFFIQAAHHECSELRSEQSETSEVVETLASGGQDTLDMYWGKGLVSRKLYDAVYDACGYPGYWLLYRCVYQLPGVDSDSSESTVG